MSTASSIAVAVTFVWLGMVLAISFLEAPLMKIRNSETLNRLAHVVEGRAARTLTADHQHP